MKRLKLIRTNWRLQRINLKRHCKTWRSCKPKTNGSRKTPKKCRFSTAESWRILLRYLWSHSQRRANTRISTVLISKMVENVSTALRNGSRSRRSTVSRAYDIYDILWWSFVVREDSNKARIITECQLFLGWWKIERIDASFEAIYFVYWFVGSAVRFKNLKLIHAWSTCCYCLAVMAFRAS